MEMEGIKCSGNDVLGHAQIGHCTALTLGSDSSDRPCLINVNSYFIPKLNAN